MLIHKPSEDDTTDLLDLFRSPMLSHLLVIGTTTYNLPEFLGQGPKSYQQIQQHFQLADRPLGVLLTAWRSLNLIEITPDLLLNLTPKSKNKLDPASPYSLAGYIGLGIYSQDIQHLIKCLKDDRPASQISFVYHENGQPSALDDPHISDSLTRAMAARAANIAPLVAKSLDLADAQHLIDIGGAHGLYSIELLREFPQLKATIIDRAAPLKVAVEYIQRANLAHRAQLAFGDIHSYTLSQKADVILMANILHDYHADDAQQLVKRFAQQLVPGGRLVILDAFLESVPEGHPPVSSGPAPVAAYSAFLFSLCEGRCYRLDEYQNMLLQAGLSPDPLIKTVPAHGSLLTGWKST